jgi:hypothetical protein
VEITLGDVGLRDFKPLHRLSLGFYNLVHVSIAYSSSECK